MRRGRPRRGDRCQRRPGRVVGDRAAGAGGDPAQGVRADDGTVEGPGAPDHPGERQGRARARGEIAYAAEFFRWFSEEAVRAIGDIQTAPSGRTGSWSCASPSASRPGHPVELPRRHGHPQDRPGPGRRLHRHPQAGLRDPPDRPRDRRDPDRGRRARRVVNIVPSKRSRRRRRRDARRPPRPKIFFTGSTEVGRRLLATASECVVNASMDLGGNDPSSSSTTPTSTPPSTAP